MIWEICAKDMNEFQQAFSINEEVWSENVLWTYFGAWFWKNRLCHFCSYTVVEKEAHFVLECPPYNFIRDKFQSLLEESSTRES